MPTYTHGGDIWSHDPGLLDFSANLHPLGMPPTVAEAVAAAIPEAARYPDPLCRDLRQAIAQRDGTTADQVICGAGAADLIFRLCLTLRPRRALVTAPTFSEYEQALRLSGCQVRYHPLSAERQFLPDDSLLASITPDLDLVFLCTPNNPTGRCFPRPLLEESVRRCAQVGCRLVLDECFWELTNSQSAVGLLQSAPHLFLLRAFTKTYAIPGLRLGYGLSSDEGLLESLYTSGQPWPVSNVAQAAGIAACGCPQWPLQGRLLLEAERPRVLKALRSMGLTVFPGEANYLLFQAHGISDLKERLLARGLLIRSCANFHGLGPDYYRVCIKTGPENDMLLAKLKEVL